VAWPEISIEDFPPRRDDEPSTLRQNIVDELGDLFPITLESGSLNSAQ